MWVSPTVQVREWLPDATMPPDEPMTSRAMLCALHQYGDSAPSSSRAATMLVLFMVRCVEKVKK
jgi:hypothetical protein